MPHAREWLRQQAVNPRADCRSPHHLRRSRRCCASALRPVPASADANLLRRAAAGCRLFAPPPRQYPAMQQPVPTRSASECGAQERIVRAAEHQHVGPGSNQAAARIRRQQATGFRAVQITTSRPVRPSPGQGWVITPHGAAMAVDQSMQLVAGQCRAGRQHADHAALRRRDRRLHGRLHADERAPSSWRAGIPRQRWSRCCRRRRSAARPAPIRNSVMTSARSMIWSADLLAVGAVTGIGDVDRRQVRPLRATISRSTRQATKAGVEDADRGGLSHGRRCHRRNGDSRAAGRRCSTPPRMPAQTGFGSDGADRGQPWCLSASTADLGFTAGATAGRQTQSS